MRKIKILSFLSKHFTTYLSQYKLTLINCFYKPFKLLDLESGQLKNIAVFYQIQQIIPLWRGTSHLMSDKISSVILSFCGVRGISPSSSSSSSIGDNSPPETFSTQDIIRYTILTWKYTKLTTKIFTLKIWKKPLAAELRCGRWADLMNPKNTTTLN